MGLSKLTHQLLPSPHMCLFQTAANRRSECRQWPSKGSTHIWQGSHARISTCCLWNKYPSMTQVAGSNDLGIMKQLYATISPPFWRRKWQPTPVSLPGESHGQRNLAGCSPRGHRVRHDWVTEHACMHHLLKNFFYFYTIFNGYFPYCFTIQFFQNIRCVVQYILEPILYPRVCASHSSTPILALPASGNQLLVLCICKFTSFMLHSLV